ncbi:BglG family transcriptional antiterminator [Longicatena caecimuris]|uniref:BglG family transcriptional antiterminator n=1 Tax=Longicatena caecimuris TaxID=1796635 RepID=A0A4R3TH58_9FIRM|nr:PTS sugar transporter subunit IIA [Longicatena caecimuris]TCU60537.1 BglG family transcriptional antiterminator [Longicatena caecimuris]
MRLCHIMNDLLEAKDYLSLDHFIKTYEVSKRTIQNDLSYLMQMSSRKGYQLHMRRGRGYLLEVTNRELLNDFIKSLESDRLIDTKDRNKSIAVYLAMQSDYVSMDKVAETFQISKTSVKKEMREVEELLESFHLQLEKKSHYGIRLIGAAHDCKQMLADFFFENNPFLENAMQDILKDFAQVNSLLVNQIEKEDLNINYNELKNVIVWLQITVFYARIHVEKQMFMTSKPVNAIQRIAWKMKEMMEACFDIAISAESLQEMEVVLRLNVRAKQPTVSFSDQLRQDVDLFLLDIDKLYNTAFSEDQDFKESLLTHVSLLIERLHQKISYKNTLIKEICIRYPMIFNIAIRFSDMLKEKYNVEVTHDEAGFIATHFAAHMERERKSRILRFNRIGVVCSSGGGSAYLIKLQIESLFSQADVETFSFLQMDELERYHPDLIFTIMPLDRDFAAPVIYIKELLDDLDLMRIRQVLQYDNCDSLSIADADSYLYSIFDRHFFQIRKSDDYLALLQEMAQQIEESGYGGEHYAQYVMERESYMSTIYMNGVCIPHPIEICANRNLISVCILEEPICYEDKQASIIFMVSLTKEDYEVHKDITKKLYQLMNDEKRLQWVLRNRTLEELLIVMKELDGGTL